ncbi:MAG: S8 family serine peptidase [Chloroflexi bacterium]|nr:S8 family serine peptidase [Chloroflexota bacterium]
MTSRWWRILTVALVLSLVLPLVVFAAPVDPNTDGVLQQAQATGAKRFFVILEGDPLALHYSKLGAPMSMSRSDGKLDALAPESQAYIDVLREKQTEAMRVMERLIPGARVATYRNELGELKPLTYQVVLNGFVVELPEVNRENLIKLSHLPGVKAVVVEHQLTLNMEVVNPTIGAPAVWEQLGGVDKAGEGVKVAVIDTGIDPNHPGLDPTGYRYPVGYPKGDTRYTTPKVIVMRGYYRPDDPPVDPAPKPVHPHGTGVATIIATNPNTVATYKGVDVTLSGVAPKAYLMSYQIFYPSAAGAAARYASDPETVKAIEQMVLDGADVVNNSWGESAFIPLKPGFNPVTDALDAAAAAGVVVVKSAGNSGPGQATVGGNDQPVQGITVGATVNTRAFGNEAKVVAPEPVPEMIQSMLAVPAAFGGTLSEDFGPEVYVDVGRIHPGNAKACDPIEDPNGELRGKVALISRGSCYFTTKVKHAQEAGAVLAIIYNNVPSAPPITMGGSSKDITIPAFMVGNLQGLAMVQFEHEHPGEAMVEVGAQTKRLTGIAPPDVLTNFSSRGPAFPLNRITPDVVAQGQNVLSGYAVTGQSEELWEPWAGTSASSPIVAGAAALLKAVHPDWEPWQVKSALMTTAKPQVWLDYAQTRRGGPMAVGAGRIQVDKAVDPGVFVKVVDPTGEIPTNQSAMFGLMSKGEQKTLVLEFYSAVDEDMTWTLSLSNPFTLPVQLSETTVTVPANGKATVELTLEIPDGPNAVPVDDAWGCVKFTADEYEGHLPFWVRVQPDEEGADVLLIDDDGSLLQPAFFGVDTADYRPYYENLLQELGVTYDVWDAERHWLQGPGLPDVATLQKYDKVIWFTGDSFLTYYGVSADATDRTRLLDFFHNTPDRKLIVTGQDWSGYYSNFMKTSDGGCVLCSLGVARWSEDAYAPAKMASPVRAALGEGPFSGMLLDLGGVMTPTVESGAGNQEYVDGLYPDPAGSAWMGQPAIRSLLPASDTPTERVPYIATMRAGDPRLEWVLKGAADGRSTSSSRAIYFAFGLEGINNANTDKGFASRKDVLERAFQWLDDEVTLSVSGPTEVTLPEPVVLSATISSSTGMTEPVSFRWSWGDDTGIVPTGSSNMAAHTYAEPGTYTVWVEGTDPLGHTAVVSTVVTVLPNPVQPVTWVTATTTVETVADTYIDAWAVPWMPPDVGDDVTMKVRGKNIKTALLGFDLSSLPEGTEILSARLKVFATNGVGEVTVGAYNVLRKWSEMKATWWEADEGVKWEEPGANGASDRCPMPADTQVVKSTGWVTFDVTKIAQAWLKGKGTGIALRGDDAAHGGEWNFVTREFPDYHPVLEIEYRYPSDLSQ